MSMPSGNTSAFFGGAIASVVFDQIGDKVRGRVIDKQMQPQTDIDDPSVVIYWDPETRLRPKMQVVVTLETHAPSKTDETDTGLERLWIRGYMQSDFTVALRKARLRDLPHGAWVECEFTSQDQPRRRGMKGARHFTVQIWEDSNPPEWADNWPPEWDENLATTEQPDEPPF